MMLMMMLTIMLAVMLMMMLAMMLLVGNAIHDITSPFNNVFHKEQPWVCLDSVGEIFFTFSMVFDKCLDGSQV
jgi:hypothetical protein